MAQPLPEICLESNQETTTLEDGRVLPTQTRTSPTADASTLPLLNNASQHSSTGFPVGLPSQAGITGHNSSYLSGITEWTFSESQSDIQGRTGSNACVFIALYMGKLCSQRNLPWPAGDSLPDSWQTSFREAMIKGNKIHDDLFDHDATNVTVEDAVSMAGEECGVESLGQQIDIFGTNPVNQLANVLVQEAQNLSCQSFSVVVSHDRAFLVVVNPDQSAMLIDSHSHGSRGGIIAYSQKGNIISLPFWLDAMMKANWQCSLTIAALTKIFF